jgi:hypothetical protein
MAGILQNKIDNITSYTTNTLNKETIMTKQTPSTLPYLSDYARGKLLTEAGIKNAKGLHYHRLRNSKPNSDPNNKPTTRTTSTTKRPVKCIQTGEVFESIHACARAHDLTPSNLCAHLKGKLYAVKKRQYKYTTDSQLKLHQKRNKTPANTTQLQLDKNM